MPVFISFFTEIPSSYDGPQLIMEVKLRSALRLENHALASRKTSSVVKCIIACSSLPLCKTVNYNTDTKNCDLNRATSNLADMNEQVTLDVVHAQVKL